MPHEHRILVLDHLDDDALRRLAAAGEVVRADPASDDELHRLLSDANAVILRTRTRLTRSALAVAGRLKVIGRAGAGVDNIDVAAAAERGILVVNTPDAATDAVADLTVGLMISLLRRIHEGDAEIRRGRYAEGRSRSPGRELHELTLGVVGMGRAGTAVGRRCRLGFGMRVLFTDLREIGWLPFTAQAVGLEQLLAESDVVSLHVPLNPTTRRLMNECTLSRMRSSAMLINTSRGEVVDPEAAAAALESGRLAGYAADVLDAEPPAPDHPLLRAPNVLLTPHIGARTRSAQARMSDVVDDVVRVLAGEAPRFPVEA
ncbi:MAG: hydroxyacid dehydrogenase [Phycisphaerae bacterium]|nr:MAG: hypothetical protein EDS66_03795 [Planctomycetota bacterium]KAB2946483.1 MAG: hydroxyacid dehydrogenase [Phycisphaerae bacterium]MBE7456700.1 hydroxyacid dehydrogenase [Planctomycetia bacterium]MCK6463922.1 hydroxyacid dehydrogenase [Phycisphaerae bacterium]MCL4718135.1 hydroxyacid dehydrogenase [Phycisphaerae bacterium]